MMMIDPDVPLRVGNSGPEYNTHTPGRHWPGFFVRMIMSAPPTSSPCSSTGGRVRSTSVHPLMEDHPNDFPAEKLAEASYMQQRGCGVS